MSHHSPDLSQLSMFNLFQMEVESQIDAFNHNLLTLETTPRDIAALQALMRSAHSIKGAARIVDIGAIVSLAHVMEDCFSFAQSSEFSFHSDDIDLFLRITDWLAQLAQVPEAKVESWLIEQQSFIEQSISQISVILP
jgi:two-component system, chemotaxis family, sensor histidine kinase and response regulator WspE